MHSLRSIKTQIFIAIIVLFNGLPTAAQLRSYEVMHGDLPGAHPPDDALEQRSWGKIRVVWHGHVDIRTEGSFLLGHGNDRAKFSKTLFTTSKDDSTEEAKDGLSIFGTDLGQALRVLNNPANALQSKLSQKNPIDPEVSVHPARDTKKLPDSNVGPVMPKPLVKYPVPAGPDSSIRVPAQNQN